MAGVEHALKSRLGQGQGLRPGQEQAQEKPQGKVALSSGSVSSDAPAKVAPVTGEIKAQVPLVADADPLINDASDGESQGIAEGMAAQGKVPTLSALTDEEVTLTEEEREAFLEALISGKRYERRFSLFGGRVKGKLRCRSTDESEAIAAWMNSGLREGKYATQLEYAVGIRNAMLAAQVADLNGTKYAELQQPLYRTRTGDKTENPGWLKQADLWSADPAIPEALVAAVYEELKLFERKYWTMVMHANDQNFWHPAESTSK